MKYYYEKPTDWVGAGEIYECDHPMYHRCTLFRSGPVGLAVVQEKYNKKTKARYWSLVEPWIVGDIFLNERFEGYFVDHAGEPDEKGLFPTVPLRKLMWALRMKPLRREEWEDWG